MAKTNEKDSSYQLDRLLTAIRITVGDSTLSWAKAPEPLSGGFWAEMWRSR